MLRHRQLVEAIESHLERRASEELADLVEQYRVAAAAACDRLRLCQTYLNEGLRGEAVHLAGVSPRLDRLARSLQLSDLDAANQRLGEWGLPPLPRVPLDAVEPLEAAREQEATLGEAARRFRGVSLARSPLRDRLAALAPLEAAEPDSGAWKSNRQRLQTPYLETAARAARTYFEKRDAAKLQSLLRAVKAYLPPAARAEIVQTIERHLDSLGGHSTRERFAAVVARAERALEAGDLQKCRSALQEWEQLGSQYEQAPPSEFRKAVVRVIAKLEEKESAARIERQHREIAARLDDDKPKRWFRRR